MIYLLPYILTFFIGIINSGKKNKQLRLYSCLAMFLVLSLIMGLRNIDYAGEDTIVYARGFNRIVENNYSFYDILTREFEKDYLFYVIAKLFSLVIADVNMWILFCASVYVSAISWFIYRYSTNLFLSYIIFLSWDFYMYNFQLMRHCFSLAFVIFSIKYVLNRNAKKYIAMLFCAATSQIVSIVSGLTFFIKGMTKKNVAILSSIIGVVFFLILVLPREELISIIFSSSLIDKERFGQFATRGGSAITNSFICGTFIIITLYEVLTTKKSITCNVHKDNLILFLIMSFVALIFYAMQFLIAEMYRVAQYFSFVIIVMVPMALGLEKNKSLKFVIICAITFFCIKHFFGGLLNAEEYYPYKFYWE